MQLVSSHHPATAAHVGVILQQAHLALLQMLGPPHSMRARHLCLEVRRAPHAAGCPAPLTAWCLQGVNVLGLVTANPQMAACLLLSMCSVVFERAAWTQPCICCRGHVSGSEPARTLHIIILPSSDPVCGCARAAPGLMLCRSHAGPA
jgi:hypothetical protein